MSSEVDRAMMTLKTLHLVTSHFPFIFITVQLLSFAGWES